MGRARGGVAAAEGHVSKPRKPAAKKPLGPDNYRDYAQAAIKSYVDKRMLLDAMLWRGIIAHYEWALESALETGVVSAGRATR